MKIRLRKAKMLNNYWEELNMKNIAEVHGKRMALMKFPDWIKNIKCPFCKNDLPPRAIREIGVKTNSRNIGDVFVTVCCEDCKKMDTLYFRSVADTMAEFVAVIQGIKEMKTEPVTEEKMYAMRYNNLIETELKNLKEHLEERNDDVKAG